MIPYSLQRAVLSADLLRDTFGDGTPIETGQGDYAVQFDDDRVRVFEVSETLKGTLKLTKIWDTKSIAPRPRKVAA